MFAKGSLFLSLGVAIIFAQPIVQIQFPENGATYHTIHLEAIAVVKNLNTLPESTYYSLNGGPIVLMDKVNTDWPTYGQNPLHTGFSESPAPKTDTVLWKAHVTGDWDEYTGPAVVDGIVYISSKGYGKTFALSAATGDTIWEFPTGPVDGIITVADGKVFVNAYSPGRTWCLDAKTGSEIWSFPGDNGMFGAPAVWNGRVYVNDYGVKVYILDEANGSLIQSRQIPNAYYTTSAVTVWDGKVYVSYRNNPITAPSLRCLDAYNLYNEIWNNDTIGGSGYHDTSPSIHDSVVFIGGRKGEIQAYDGLTGHLKWAFDTHSGGERGVLSTPAIHNGMVFAGDQNMTMWAVTESTGTYVWDFKIGEGRIYSSPAIADGMVFFGGWDDKVYGVDELTGNKIWEHNVGADVFSSGAVTDGVLYISTDSWFLYAFGSLMYKYRKPLTAVPGENTLVVSSVDSSGSAGADTVVFYVELKVDEDAPAKTYSSFKIYPNPCVSGLNIEYSLPSKRKVCLRIYDLTGRLVRTLVEGEQRRGIYNIRWNTRDNRDKKLPSGIYFLRLDLGDLAQTRILILL